MAKKSDMHELVKLQVPIEGDMQFTRKKIVTEELETAIEMYFSGQFISAHLLAAAANEILRILCQAKKIKSYSAHVHDLVAGIKNPQRDKIIAYLNLPYNFFKHSNHDSEACLRYSPEYTAFLIVTAIYDYVKIYAPITQVMSVFGGWFAIRFPDTWENNEALKEAFAELKKRAGILETLPLNEALKFGYECLEGII